MFKVDDKVELIANSQDYAGIELGNVGIVVSPNDYNGPDEVRVEMEPLGYPLDFSITDFKLIECPELDRVLEETNAVEDDRRTCYIAGPMRGYLNYNFAAFDEAEARIKELYPDIRVINPAQLDRDSGIDGTNVDDAAFTPEFMRGIVRRDLDAIMSLRVERRDFLVLLPFYWDSVGASTEAVVGKWLGLKMYSYPDFKKLIL